MEDARETGSMYLLPVDHEILIQQIANLRQKSLIIAEIVQEAIEQSSETTHDNAPYDAARHEREMAERRLGDLLRIQRAAAIIPIPEVVNEATIGTITTLKSEEEELKFEIAGDWHGRHEVDDIPVISRASPLASNILGKRPGEIVTLDNKTWELTMVEPSAGGPVMENFENKSTAEESDWRERRILFVTGPHASGKSSVIKEALDAEEFTIIDTGPTLREKHKLESPDLSFEEWVKQGEEAQGPDYTNEVLLGHVKSVLEGNRAGTRGVVITGNRSIDGINYLKTGLGSSDSKILYVIAPKNTLFERYKAREGRKDLSQSEFEDILEGEMQRGLYSVAGYADQKLLNTGELSKAAEKVRTFVDEWTKED